MRQVPDMPELVEPSDIRIPNLLINSFVRASADAFSDRGHVHNLVRLSDKAVREYHAARKMFSEWAPLPPMHLKPFWEGISRLESCINAAHKANLHARWLNNYNPDLGLPVLPEHLRKPLNDIRNAIEHVDKWLERGRLQHGHGPITLNPGEHDMSIATESLSYDHLAKSIEIVDSAADQIIVHDWQVEDSA